MKEGKVPCLSLLCEALLFLQTSPQAPWWNEIFISFIYFIYTLSSLPMGIPSRLQQSPLQFILISAPWDGSGWESETDLHRSPASFLSRVWGFSLGLPDSSPTFQPLHHTSLAEWMMMQSLVVLLLFKTGHSPLCLPSDSGGGKGWKENHLAYASVWPLCKEEIFNGL